MLFHRILGPNSYHLAVTVLTIESSSECISYDRQQTSKYPWISEEREIMTR